MQHLSSVIAILAVCVIFCSCCHAFVLDTKKYHHRSSGEKSQSSQLRVIPPEILNDVQASRMQFTLWFFGGSGGVGIALSAFPRMYKQVQYIQSLKGIEPSLGGNTLGVSPLCGYPEDLSIKDLEKVVNNKMTVEQMVQKFPIEGNFLSEQGYVTFDAFDQANKGNNPLAVRAVFDTFAQSTDVCNPNIAQEKIDSYKENISGIKGGLLKSKVTGYVSIFTLLFLLGLAEFVTFGHARDGWLYYWKLSDGILNIPDYWI